VVISQPSISPAQSRDCMESERLRTHPVGNWTDRAPITA